MRCPSAGVWLLSGVGAWPPPDGIRWGQVGQSSLRGRNATGPLSRPDL